ncbi:antitoxin Xre/MbcA/ParS toxin-binding domain-containing protein [Roseateles sp.]|jgi:transcriptional regulator with XRE-family HTH domain|uniref:antitoxin Xre/MbcA/ParS toxin-binding domain-containing protein n=1 Tax=Roseateles sp. TaxID=1971397 RepID=UPI00391B6BFF
MQASPVMEVDRTYVLGKATQRAADALGLNGRELAQTVGFSEPTVSRILKGERGIDPASKEGQLSLMLVRVFRSLDALVGGDAAKRQTWMTSHNSALNGVPAALILTAEGLGRTLAYLDGMRAPI